MMDASDPAVIDALIRGDGFQSQTALAEGDSDSDDGDSSALEAGAEYVDGQD